MLKKSLFLLVSILVMVTTSVLFTGCGNKQSQAAANRWTGLLGVIPANELTLNEAYLRDDTLKAEMLKQYPTSQPFHDSFPDYYFPASGTVLNAQDYSEADWQKDLGFTEADVQKVIIAGDLNASSSGDDYQAAEGTFDKEAIDNAVKTESLQKELKVIEYDGQDYYSAGADNQIDLTLKSGAHALGMAYRMALLDNTVLWSNVTDRMQEMIDAYKNKAKSLADVKDYQFLSKTLEDTNVFYAFFTSYSYSLNHIKQIYEEYRKNNPADASVLELESKMIAELDNAVLLKPFDALASGVGLDANGYYLVIALANPDAATAKENATLLEQRLDQAKEIASIPGRHEYWADVMNGKREISTQGNITIAKIYGDAYKLWTFTSVFPAPMWGFINNAFIVTEPGDYTPVVPSPTENFNSGSSITIITPSSIEGVHLTLNSSSSIGGSNDLSHQQINYEISISNQGTKTAANLQLFIDTYATSQGFQTIEAQPAQKPVSLAPDQTETYKASWEYDMSNSSKMELVDLMKKNVIRATWTGENGQEQEQVLQNGG